MNLARSKDEWLAAGNTLQRDGLGAGPWVPVHEPPPRTRKPLGVAAAGALVAVLVPKCPMCVAMYLSFLGAAASWFMWLRPLGIALSAAGLAVAAWRHLSRRTRTSTRTT